MHHMRGILQTISGSLYNSSQLLHGLWEEATGEAWTMTEYHCILCNRDLKPDENTIGHPIKRHNVNPDHVPKIETRVIKSK